MTQTSGDAASGHAALVTLALVVLVAVVALTAVFARSALQMVAYSSVYVLGVVGFWLVYWLLSTRAADRRQELLEAED